MYVVYHSCYAGVLRLIQRRSADPGKLPIADATVMDVTASEHVLAVDLEPILSQKQLKKQKRRDEKKSRQGEKKARKQNAACDAALAVLDGALADLLSNQPSPMVDRQKLKKNLCSAFGVNGHYRSLPMAHGPAPSQGVQLLRDALIRPAKYNEKFLPQEYSLLHKAWVLLGRDCSNAGILDIGAGNACCAVLAATLLGLTVICVERESPRIELRAEAQLPPKLQNRVIRLESDVADFGLSALKQIVAERGLERVILMAKHPCGIGVDRSIEFAFEVCKAANTGSGMPPVVGAVIATCCTNKLSQDDFHETRVAEFCSFYHKDMPKCCAEAGFERSVDIMSRCSAWRTASESRGNAIHDEQLEWAELFEDSLQALRLQRLRQIFSTVNEVRFAPRNCTMQDRCLLACTGEFPDGLLAHGDDCHDDHFHCRIQRGLAELFADGGGPIDLRPKGLKSTKYDFDYTALDKD